MFIPLNNDEALGSSQANVPSATGLLGTLSPFRTRRWGATSDRQHGDGLFPLDDKPLQGRQLVS